MKFTFLFIILFSFFGMKNVNENLSQKRTNFNVTIKHFYSGEGETITWNISEKLLKVNYECDLKNCEKKVLYSAKIDSDLSKLFFSKVKALQLNKLEKSYQKEYQKDGLKENILIKNIYDEEVKIFIHGKKVKLIEDLYKLTDSILLKKTDFKIIK